jgi:hypothetical protein
MRNTGDSRLCKAACHFVENRLQKEVKQTLHYSGILDGFRVKHEAEC